MILFPPSAQLGLLFLIQHRLGPPLRRTPDTGWVGVSTLTARQKKAVVFHVRVSFSMGSFGLEETCEQK